MLSLVCQAAAKGLWHPLHPEKKGMKLRIYPEHIQRYQSFLDTLPEKAKAEIRKPSPCNQLANPDDCNPKCIMGYTFLLDDQLYQKCRCTAFQLALSEENNPYIMCYIMCFLEKELQEASSQV